MFAVQAVSRDTIDAWPVEEAGLPTRVINSVKAAKVLTVGDLRTWSEPDLLRLRSLGRVSLEQIQYFFKLCDRIERGIQRFESIHDVLDIFLDVHQLSVISARYGFYQRDLVASRNWVTLQEIGNRENKTRERVRQVEDMGKQKLRSRMARVCLQPFYEFFTTFINQRARAVGTSDLATIRNHEALRELNPASVLLLLSDLAPDHIVLHHDFFSTLPLDVLKQVEKGALGMLENSPSPLSIDDITNRLPPSPEFADHSTFRQAASVVLDHAPTIGSTIDDRYFLYTTSVQPFLVEIMERMERPAHYRTVTSRFNDRVKPRSRKGAGYILDVLNRNPRCVRVDRGIYSLS
jgi:hypothetical protein